jgi:hypothetical protein
MPHPRRHALLVGVDRYPNLPAKAQLRSCVNDARLMHKILIRRYGFREEDVVLLLDEDATHDGILAGFAALRDRARCEDTAVFYYSGHGSQVVDPHNDEPDAIGNAIVPHDSGRHPWPNCDIEDTVIYGWVLALCAAARHVAVIADTCFSAGVTRAARAAPAAREKWIEPYRLPPAELPPPVWRGGVTRSTTRDAGPSGLLPLDDRYVLLAACRRYQRARELTRQDQSAFTFCLCQALERVPAGTTYRDLTERVCLAVALEVQEQTPQVEGARDRVLFGGAARPPAPFLPVVARQGSHVQLGGGAVQGVHRGSVWAIHPAGTHRPARASFHGLVRIDDVQAVTSAGEIAEEAGRIEPGDRAFERAKGPGWLRLPVELSLHDPGAVTATGALAAAVIRSPLLRLTDQGGESGAVRIELVNATAEACGKAPAPRLPPTAPAIRVEEPSWVALSQEGELLLAPVARDQPGALRQVVCDLERLARARNLLAIEPEVEGDADEERGSLAAGLEIELLRRRGSEPYQPVIAEAGGEVVYLEGDRLALRVLHHANLPLYIHVLDIGLAGTVNLIYPLPGAYAPLIAERPFEIGTREGQELTVCIPKDFDARARAAGQESPEGREVLRVFATAQEADLSVWQQPDPQRDCEPERSTGGTLAALVDRALGRGAGRITRGDSPTRAPDDLWTVRTLTFLVRRAAAPAPPLADGLRIPAP